MSNSSTLYIDLDALEHNVNRLSKNYSIMAMVKANAYGTDAVTISSYLKKFGVPMLGVAQVQEAVVLRKAGIDLPIFVLSAPPFEAKTIVKYNLQPAVSSFEEADALKAAAKDKLHVHLHVNTGMYRFGIDCEKAIELSKYIQQTDSLHLEGIMTHFTSSDSPEMDCITKEQALSFKKVVDSIEPRPRWIHAANSYGSVRFSLPFCNMTRVGIGLFGYCSDGNFFNYDLKPALTLQSKLVFIDTPKKGDSVGYYGAYKVAKSNMRIGVVSFGYHDGLHCHYKEKGYVLINNKKAHMIGNICMDFIMVDLSEIPEARVGDTVTLFDSYLRPETVAAWGESSVKEFLSNIGGRTQRVLYKSGANK